MSPRPFPSLYTFRDYRTCLRAYYDARKISPSGYSYAQLSEDLGLRSSNHAQLILEGKRALSIAGIHAYADLANLDDDERAYLELLRLREELEDPRHLQRVDRRLAAYRRGKPATQLRMKARSGSESLLDERTLPALLVLLDGKETARAAELALRALGLPKSETSAGIHRLRETGILTESAGTYRATSAHVVHGDPRQISLRQKKYLREQLEESQRQFEKNYERGAKFASHTFSVGSERAAEIERKLAAYFQTLIEEMDSPENEHVLQVNLQVFTPIR